MPVRVLVADKANSHEHLVTAINASIPLFSKSTNLIGDSTLSLYDTQDWALSLSGHFVETQSFFNNSTTISIFSDLKTPSRFSLIADEGSPEVIHLSKVKEVGVRRLLEQLAGERSLVKMASIPTFITEIELSQQNTGLKVGKVRLITPRGLPEQWIEIELTAGIDPALILTRIKKTLKSHLISNTNWDRWASVMRSGKRKRFDYNQLGRTSYSLKDTPLAALKTMAMNLYQRVNMNLDGVVRDYDLEYCHDVRVDLRKLRVIMEHLQHLATKGSPAKKCHLKQLENEVKRFQTLCGTQRDLDVFLNTFSTVETNENDLLTETIKQLTSQRDAAHKILADYINGKQLVDLLNSWKTSFQCLEQQMAPNVKGQKISNFADHSIFTTYKDFVAQTQRTVSSSTYEEMHNLRKKGKHLRYTLELFQPVFSAVPFRAAVRELKVTQDLLGAFQDKEVAFCLLHNLPSTSSSDLQLIKQVDDERESLFRLCMAQARQLQAAGGIKGFDLLFKELKKRP